MNSNKVTTTRGGVLHVVGIRDVNLDKLGTIKKILHVLDLKTHRISRQKLVDDNGWVFILESDDCFLCDKVSTRKISLFRREVGLLVFNDPASMCQSLERHGVITDDRVLMLHVYGSPYF